MALHQAGGSPATAAEAPARPRGPQAHWVVLPILAVAALLRFHRLLDGGYHGDEAEYVAVAKALLQDPFALEYPRLERAGPTPFVSQPPFVLLLFAVGASVAGITAGPLLVSATLGTATVLVTYAIGCGLRGRWLGGIAAFLLAVLPYHVGVSRSAQLDAGFTFLVALTMLLALRWAKAPSPWRALATGFAAGATVLAKLPGVLVLVPLAVLVLHDAFGSWTSGGRRLPGGRPWRQLRLECAALLAPVVAAGTAYLALLWHLEATKDLFIKLGWQAGRVAGSVSGISHRGPLWAWTDPIVGLPVQLGPFLLVLAVAGAVLAAKDLQGRPERRLQALLLAWPLAFVLFFSVSARKEWFDLMPAMPALMLLAAWCAERLRTALHGVPDASLHRDRRVPIALAVSFLVVAAALVPTTAAWSLRVQDAGRFGRGLDDAAVWIDQQDPNAGQVGSILGRFTLQLGNGHPTFHVFANHTDLDHRIGTGEVRYLVRDPYLKVEWEDAWMDGLVERHDATLVQEFKGGQGEPVQVWEFGRSVDFGR